MQNKAKKARTPFFATKIIRYTPVDHFITIISTSKTLRETTQQHLIVGVLFRKRGIYLVSRVSDCCVFWPKYSDKYGDYKFSDVGYYYSRGGTYFFFGRTFDLQYHRSKVKGSKVKFRK